MIVRRPIGAWSAGIEEIGSVLMPSGDGERIGFYALLEGDVVAWLEPSSKAGAGFKLRQVPRRERVVLSGRYPDRNLRFPRDPSRVPPSRRRPLPLQDVEPRHIRLTYTGDQRRSLLRCLGQTLAGDWDLDVADLDQRRVNVRETSEKPVRAAIARTGRYILVEGAGRLAAAYERGHATVPVEIVARHPEWEAFRERLIAYGGRRQGKIYQRLVHPDLADLRASQDDDRLALVVRALDGVPPDGKRLIDIGAQWGQVSRAMEDLGFTVTAVEANPASAAIAARLRDATERRYEVWEGSVFDFPRIEEQDVVVALNIFHHFLKTQDAFEGLVSILDRMSADVIIFAAYVHDSGSDFKGAYRSFPPAEFARFVAEHSGLPQIDLVGKSHDGRHIYRLAR